MAKSSKEDRKEKSSGTSLNKSASGAGNAVVDRVTRAIMGE